MQRIFNNIATKTNPDSDAIRVFHGRGHCYDGLAFITVDWFSPLLLVTFFKEPSTEWFIEFKQRCEALEGLECSIEVIVFQYRYQRNAPVDIIKGELPEGLNARENGLEFRLNLGKNQNIGFFLDMKNVRKWLSSVVKGKKVLNLFSYTCAFSVVAIDSGADSVVNMDMAKGALSTGKLNHRINNLGMDSVRFFSHDIFKSWGKLRKYGPYDCIILDPPSFQRGSFDAKKDYIKIVKKLPELLADGGVVIACLNSPELDFDYLRNLFDGVMGFSEQQVIPVPDTFPETDNNKGLKTIVFKKLSHHNG